MSRVRLQIFGKVQGVYYRHSARNQANLLALTGWVRNMADGSVMVEADGLPSNLSSFIDWCKQGPPNARVDSVKVDQLTDEIAGHKSFEIL